MALQSAHSLVIFFVFFYQDFFLKKKQGVSAEIVILNRNNSMIQNNNPERKPHKGQRVRCKNQKREINNNNCKESAYNTISVLKGQSGVE
jgi:hypothetical protein